MRRTINAVRAIIAAAVIAVAVPAGAFVPQTTAIEASAATVKIKPSSKTINVGDTIKIKLKNNTSAVTWSSSTSHVEIVKKTKKFAKVKGVSAGTSRITAKVGSHTYSCYVTVKSDGSTTTPEVSDNSENGRALSKAQSYLRVSAFSKEGLKDQLAFEKFSASACEYAVNSCGADWMEQALKKAKSYLNVSAFSKSGLQEQLEFEKFTSEEAAYGVANCGADWMEQAAKKAKSYLKISSFSKDGLIEQLEFEGFTHEEAVYGADVAY